MIANRPTKHSESQNSPSYTGVVWTSGNLRLVVSPGGGRYILQERVPTSGRFRVIRWAKTYSRITQRKYGSMDRPPPNLLPEYPADAAPETVARRALENEPFIRNSVFRCDYERVVVRDGRTRIVVSPQSEAYLWQVAETYWRSHKIKPNKWQTILRAPNTSLLKEAFARGDIVWPFGADPEAQSAHLRVAIWSLPEHPQDGDWPTLPTLP